MTDSQVIWKPMPGPQTALIACPIFEVFYGGARGGGKTEGSIGDWLQHSGTYNRDATGIFVRRTIKQLSEVIARTQGLFPQIGAKWNDQKSTWTMPGGARLKFVYLERDKDAEEYQGHSYTRVYIEEAPNFASPGPINKLRATLRSAAGVPVGMRLTGNPGGPGHGWVKDRYIKPNKFGYEIIKEETEVEIDGKIEVISLERVFIPSKIRDNTLILKNDPGYIMRLKQSGSEALVKAWLDGDWDIVDGAFFDNWDEDRHIISWESFKKILTKSMLKFRAFDWGSSKPFSVGWYALLDRDYYIDGRLLPQGALVRYKEWYGASGPNKGLKMDASAVARGILNRELGEKIRYGVADPAIFIRDGGPSIAEIMNVEGCQWRPADNKRMPGWEQFRTRLNGDAGIPMFYVTDICIEAIRLIPMAQHDQKNTEDLDTEGEDHLVDEIRYAMMSRPFIPKAENLNKAGFKVPTIQELIAARTRARKTQQANRNLFGG